MREWHRPRSFGPGPAERILYRIGNSIPGTVPMPVTVKLSKLFYDRLGEEIGDELVNWFNQVDATYRGDLREMNELNFARFDAKLERRLAELRAELRGELAEIKVTLERRLGEQTRWLFVAWASLLIPSIGLWIRR